MRNALGSFLRATPTRAPVNYQMEVKGFDQQYVPAKALLTVAFLLFPYVVGLIIGKRKRWGAKIINLKSNDKAIYEKV